MSLGGIALIVGLNFTGGQLIYGLDDPYIHLRVAQNVVHGVWGLNPGEPISTSSSPLWTGLLALCLAILPSAAVYWPLLLNIVLWPVALLVLDRIMATGHFALTAKWRVAALIAAAIIAPFTALLAGGMEHLLQIVLFSGFLVHAAIWIATPAMRPPRYWWLITLIFGLVRPEAAFLVIAAGILLLIKGRWRDALVVGLVSAVGPGLFALYTWNAGAGLIPTAYLLKTNAAGSAIDLRGELIRLALTLLALPYLTIPVVIQLVIAIRSRRVEDADEVQRWHSAARWMFLIVYIQHVFFSRMHWFFRYEAYLALWGFYLCLYDWLAYRRRRDGGDKRKLLFELACGLALFAQLVRGLGALYATPFAMRNIYHQQWQMAQFVERYYPDKLIVANDIGLLSFHTGAPIYDAFGLASHSVLNSKRDGTFGAEFLEREAAARGASIALIYPEWLGSYGGVPAAWTPVFKWKTPRNVVLGVAWVSVYAIRVPPEELRRQWAEFAKTMPAGITIEFIPAAPPAR